MATLAAIFLVFLWQPVFMLSQTSNLVERLNSARAAFQEGHLEKSEAELLTILKNDPRIAQAYNLLGEIRLRQERISEARDLFLKAIELLPSPDAYENLLLLELLSGRPAAAEAPAKRLKQLDPENYNANLALAILSFDHGEHAQCLEYLQGLVEGPDPLALALRIKSLEKVGRGAESAQARLLLASHNVQPQDARLAAKLFRSPDLQDYAIQWLKLSAPNNSDRFRHDVELAEIYRERSEWKQTEDYLRKAHSIRPSDVKVLLRLAETAERLGQREAAVQYLGQARNAPKNDSASLLDFGLACIQRRLMVDAHESFAQVIIKEPNNALAHYLLGVVLS